MQAMSSDENTKVILRWFEAVDMGDMQVLDKLADELFAPDFIWHDPRMTEVEPGPENGNYSRSRT